MANLDSILFDGSQNDYQQVTLQGSALLDVAKRTGEPQKLEFTDLVDFAGATCETCSAYKEQDYKKLVLLIQQNVKKGQTSFDIPDVFQPEKFNLVEKGQRLTQTTYFTKSIPVWDNPAQKISFTGQGIQFSSDFVGARMNFVVERAPNEFEVHLNPETSSPINPSPWYAFQMQAIPNRDGNVVEPHTIRIKIIPHGFTEEDGKVLPIAFRYQPKISRDGIHWENLPKESIEYPDEQLEYGISGERTPPYAILTVSVDSQPLWIAAQELHTSTRIAEWVQALDTKPFVQSEVIGQSRGGRDIHLLDIKEGSPHNPYIVIIGGQHPPEVTGRLALESFVETLAGDSDLAKKFRRHFNIAVVPDINPDGIDGGYWRFNGGGIDLNRDWKEFEQPETQAVRSRIEQLQKNGIAFFVDFHSTYYDTMYLSKSPAKGIPYDRLWLERILASRKQREGDAAPMIKSKSVPIEKPTSLSWARKTFEASAVTYEVGDSTPRDLLKTHAINEAEILMQLLLKD